MMVQVKNPHSSSENRYGEVVAGLSKKMKPEYPASLQEAFTGKRKAEVKFAALQPEMLNVRKTERSNGRPERFCPYDRLSSDRLLFPFSFFSFVLSTVQGQ
jgi:hypothetical protein